MSRKSNAVVLNVIGAILVAPLIYNTAEVVNKPLNWVFVFFGASLVTIGIIRLTKLRAEGRGNASAAAAAATPEAEGDAATNRLALFFRRMGHLTTAITLLATAFLVLSIPIGGASGVPIAIGLIVAGMFYGLSSLASK